MVPTENQESALFIKNERHNSGFALKNETRLTDSGLVMVDLIRSTIGMVDLAFWDYFFEQNRSWDDFGTINSGS